MLLIVMGIEDRCGLVAQELVRLLHRLWDILRLRHGISENAVPDIRDVFRRDGDLQRRHLCILDDGACRLRLIGCHRPDDQRYLLLDQLLRRIHRVRRNSLRILHQEIDREIALLIDLLDSEAYALLLRLAICGRTARQRCREADLRRILRAGRHRAACLAAAAGDPCHHDGSHRTNTDRLHYFSHMHHLCFLLVYMDHKNRP